MIKRAVKTVTVTSKKRPAAKRAKASVKRRTKIAKLLDNPHPGKILQEEFLEPLGLSQNALAQAIGVPTNRINEIIRGRRGISADTDLRLARFFKLSEGFWLRLQNTYDMMEARRDVGKTIGKIKPFTTQDALHV